MRLYVQCIMRRQFCTLELSTPVTRRSYNCNRGHKSYGSFTRPRPVSESSSPTLQAELRHAVTTRAYSVRTNLSSRSSATESTESSLLSPFSSFSSFSSLNRSKSPLQLQPLHPLFYQKCPHHQRLLKHNRSTFPRQRVRHGQFHPFTTSSSSGPGSGSGPRLATFNQVRRGCRKEQRARIPISPAMVNRTQLKGVCLKVGITKPKKPNSGQRKIARVKLSTGKVVTAFIPGEGK